ncbi:MAG: FAD:protein FMN transferase [Aeromicrobium sp.]|nr:FAD:protein FMN transferase [Aeromicrobium sp.]
MRRFAFMAILLALATTVVACGPGVPVTVSKEAIGTVVSITAYGDDEDAVRDAIDNAYAAMAEVESALNAHDPASAISRFNATPFEDQELPPDAVQVLDAIETLEVSEWFSPALLSVTQLYDFEDGGTVPAEEDVLTALVAASRFDRTCTSAARFRPVEGSDTRLQPGGPLAPGLDLGGAAKGLALDRARETLRASGSVTAALITSTSTTVTLGTKPDGTPWRVGVEDPRETGRVTAVFEITGDGALSTSGDYQRYFEVSGTRYHHILDPATGRPARGMRSLTVAGTWLTGLETDVLSTALFVAGTEDARGYAVSNGIALYTVDAEGRTLVVPAPEESGVRVTEQATPLP